METSLTKFFFCLLFSALFSLTKSSHAEPSRSQFPKEFHFGVATSSYQVEGAVLEDGRGLNTWDVFTRTQGNILDGDNGDVAVDHYHRYKEDIELMHSLGVNAYRFSLSWTRILPKGRFGDINPKGIEFYNNLIDSLVEKGIEPFVTISHHDIPQELEDQYGSWLSPLIQDDFVIYADICFKSFGDRVKYWITINEPNLFSQSAYGSGTYPPGRCSAPFGNCRAGNSETEQLIAVHNMILSHAKAADIYRKHYKAKQGGYLTIVPHAGVYYPLNDNEVDRDAANRAFAYSAPWILDPVIHGDYPPEMRKYLGDSLPKFSPEETKLVNGSVDLLAFNNYVALYAKDCIHSSCVWGGHAINGFLETIGERNGIPVGERTAHPRFYVYPDGLEKLIERLKTRYNNMPMYLLENGMCQLDGPIAQHNELIHDTQRVNYHKGYIAAVQRTIQNGANIQGYFVWSFIDNFEWIAGYSLRFGMYYVDYNTMERTEKSSAKWFRHFLSNATKLDQQAIKIVTPKEQDFLATML
ncbi:beta-glucosidase [Ranunculus cassubicifolius]